MNNSDPKKLHMRFRTPDQLQTYLERAGNTEFSFRAYPISAEPETFLYNTEYVDFEMKTQPYCFSNVRRKYLY